LAYAGDRVLSVKLREHPFAANLNQHFLPLAGLDGDVEAASLPDLRPLDGLRLPIASTILWGHTST
jgi:hypothetical protein